MRGFAIPAAGALQERQVAVATSTRRAALADGPELLPLTPTADMPFGWPASDWLDLCEAG